MDISKEKCVFQRREAEWEIWSSCEIVTLFYMELFGKDTTAILQRKNGLVGGYLVFWFTY